MCAKYVKLYANLHVNVTQELLDTIDNNDPHYQIVTKLLYLAYNRHVKEGFVQAKWRSFNLEDLS